jgi:hypothetical protein
MKKVNKYSGRKLKKPNMKQEGNFTQIPNAFILNPEIRDPELRLLLYIMMHSDNRAITTKNCILYLRKTKPAIGSSFEKLIALGVLKITDENIEIHIPEEMKKYKLGYFESKENITTEANKTLPSNSENPIEKGKENLTTEVKKTLLSSKENITPKVKNSYKNPLEYIDNDDIANPVILNNNRVLPVPAASGSTEQPHSNGKTKVKIGNGLDLECVSLSSARNPSGVPQTPHTPMGKVEIRGKESSLPIEGNTLPIVEEIHQSTAELVTQPIEPDIRFAEQLEFINTSKYFLPKNLNEVKNLYNNYAREYPNRYMPIIEFEEVLVYLMAETLSSMVKMRGINSCFIYRNDICHHFKDIPQLMQYMLDNPIEIRELLEKFELNK